MRVLLTLFAVGLAAEPLGTVIRLLGQMSEKVAKESGAAQAEQKKYAEFCRSTNQESGHNIDRNNDNIQQFSAALSKANSEIESLSSSIVDLASKTASDESDLAAATKLRNEQRTDYETGQKELVETIDALVRAAGVLRKAGLGGRKAMAAALTQVMSGLSVVMDAAVLEIADRKKLQALLQSEQKEDDADFENPTAAAYKSHSSNIIETIAELKVKAEAELSDLRKEEMERQHSFDMLSQGLEDGINTQNRDRKNDQASLSENQENKGKAEGDLAQEKSDLSTNSKYLDDTTHECAERKSDFEATEKSRAEEREAIAKATEVIQQTMKGANAKFVAAGETGKKDVQSFMQVAAPSAAREQVVDVIKAAARKFRSVELAQLAVRAQEDTFGKIKGLIRDMIHRLQKKSAAESDHNAYCNSERKESRAKRDDITNKHESFAARHEQAKANEADLKQEVADLSDEVSKLDGQIAEATGIRQEEARAYGEKAAGFSVADEGLNRAISVLRDYFATKGAASHEKKTDGANGIIAMIETAVQDVANSQAEAELAEKNAAKSYEKMMQEAKTSKASKEASVKAKTGEIARIAQLIGDLQNDVEGSAQELDAVNAYLEKLKGMCEHKPQSFADRAAAMQSEIAGLKQALEILESETAASFLQK